MLELNLQCRMCISLERSLLMDYSLAPNYSTSDIPEFRQQGILK